MYPALFFIGFFFFAISNNMLGPLITNIMESTGMTLAQSGLLVSFLQGGALIGMALAFFIMKRVRQKSVVKAGYLLLALSLALVALFASRSALLVGYTILGFASFFIDSGSNAVLASDFYEKRALYIPLLHFVFSGGAIVTGYVILPFKGKQWPLAFALVSLLSALIFIFSFFGNKKKNQIVAEEKEELQDPILPILKDKAFILYSVVMMLYMGSQIICVTWIPLYVESDLAQGNAVVATSLTLFWIGTAISRLIVGPIMHKGAEPYSLSIWGMVLAGLSLIAAMVFSNIVVVLLFITLCGFFAGATIPMFIVVASSWYPNNTAFISLAYILSGTIGRMIFPWAVTMLATVSSLGFALLTSSLMLLVSALLIVFVKKYARKSLS